MNPQRKRKPKLVSNTRIYLDMRRVFNQILDCVPNFPKDFRYTIGAELQRLCVRLVREIAAAYTCRDKEGRVARLTEFQTDFETMKLLVRTAGERKWIRGTGRLADLVETIDSVGKQSSAWKRSLLDEQGAAPEPQRS